MKLSNSVLLSVVWSAAVTSLVLLLAAISQADEPATDKLARQIVMAQVVEHSDLFRDGRPFGRTMLAVSDGSKLILYLIDRNGGGMYPWQVRDLDRDFSIEPNLSRAEQQQLDYRKRLTKRIDAKKEAEQAAELEVFSAQEGDLLQ